MTASIKTSVWRPNASIRAKVIGIVKYKNKLLVCEVLDDEGNLKGWCPLGGGIEFGETSEQAIKREILEELECEIVLNSPPITYESIFDHHGVKGHEIIFAFSIQLCDPSLYHKERFQIAEHDGSLHWVEWVDIEKFKRKQEILFPETLSIDAFLQ